MRLPIYAITAIAIIVAIAAAAATMAPFLALAMATLP